MKTTLLTIAYGFFAVASLGAADLPGSADFPGIMRYKGAQIIRYEKISFERYLVPLGPLQAIDGKYKLTLNVTNIFGRSSTLSPVSVQVIY